MPDRLLARLGRRITFVVGKGGVGKSTTAAGLALALADAGETVHLLSTDPAHSLADVFGTTPAPEPTRSPCSDALSFEELDAERLARDRLSPLGPELQELIERGTYLDEADAGSLVEGTVPGLDEIGAALRIARLALGERRLVVDTAPTGHTLRLLDVPDVIRGWIRVFRTMADKADTVATALVGQPVRLTAEERLDALLADMEAFEGALREAEFVVVTAPGAVVAAETHRLLKALEGRGMAVAAEVAAARPGAEADVLLPVQPGLVGCEALRAWWASAAAVTPRPSQPAPRPRSEPGPETLPPELDRELILFAGKGGVGKTTCAAAAAVLAARRVGTAEPGAVALVGADPAGSLHDVLPDPPRTVEVRDLDARGDLDRVRDLYAAEVEEAFATVGLDRAARMDRDVVESLWELAPPGIDELIAIARLATDLEPGRRMILDPAPTGHFLRLVAMPELALDWTHRIMRILLKYKSLGGLDAPASHLLRFAKRIRGLRERLADTSRTAIVLVTLDEPVVRAETTRLADRLRRLGLEPSAVLVNRAADPVAPDLAAAAFAAPVVAEPVGADALARFARSWERLR